MSPKGCGRLWNGSAGRVRHRPTPHSVYVSVTDGDKQYTVTAEDEELPGIKVIKTSAADGSPVENAVYSIEGVTCAFSTSVSTGPDGSALVEDLPAGVYIVREESVPEPFVPTASEQTIALRPGRSARHGLRTTPGPASKLSRKILLTAPPLRGSPTRSDRSTGTSRTRWSRTARARRFWR